MGIRPDPAGLFIYSYNVVINTELALDKGDMDPDSYSCQESHWVALNMLRLCLPSTPEGKCKNKMFWTLWKKSQIQMLANYNHVVVDGIIVILHNNWGRAFSLANSLSISEPTLSDIGHFTIYTVNKIHLLMGKARLCKTGLSRSLLSQETYVSEMTTTLPAASSNQKVFSSKSLFHLKNFHISNFYEMFFFLSLLSKETARKDFVCEKLSSLPCVLAVYSFM